MDETTVSDVAGAESANPAADAQTAPEATYEVKLGDETHQVTLEELQKGYLRQADYTRKTQDLANQRTLIEPYQAMKAAFDENPAAALETVSEFYGVRQAAPTPPNTQSADELWDNPEGTHVMQDDPRIAQLNAQIQRIEANQAAQNLDAAGRELVERHPDADIGEVQRHAQANGFPSLESAYRDLNWERAQEALARQAEQQATEAEVLAAKQGLAPIAGGSNAAVGSVDQNVSTKGMSFKEILAANFQKAGIDPSSL